MRNSQVHFLTAQSMAASFNSNPLNLTNMIGVSIQANYTGSSLGGTFKLQGSVDHVENNNNVQNAGNWLDIPNSSVTISATGNYAWDDVPTAFPYVRVVYTAAMSDSGSCDLWAFTKSGMGM